MDDLISSQIWARRLKWGAPNVEEQGTPIWYNFNAGHGYGGAAMHHYGVWPRYHPEELGLPYLAHISPPSHGPDQWVAPKNGQPANNNAGAE